MKHRSRILFFFTLAFSAVLAACTREGGNGPGGKVLLRVGHFSNVTHAQALVAQKLKWFEEKLGPEVEIQWFFYNAGPSAMEALLIGSIDLTYVGPSPALNTYVKSRGEEVRIVSGAARGGAALVVQGDGRIKTPSDFKGKKVATPQLGNTQDVACRAWLKAQGLHVTQLGGDVQVLPTANPEQLSLFQTKALDAVWTVEPWVSRLEMEAGGKVFLEEKETVTTVLVSSVRCLREKRDLVRRFVKAHAELTEWIQKNSQEAQRLVREQLKAETKRDMPAPLLERAWGRLTFTSEVERRPLEEFLTAARAAGFIREAPDLGRLLETP